MAHLGQLSNTAPSVLSLQMGRNDAANKLLVMTFSANDLVGIVLPYSDPQVLSVHIDGQRIHRVLMDGRSGANVLYKSCFDRMNINRSSVSPTTSRILGFLGEKIQPVGKVNLPIMVSDYIVSQAIVQEFHFIDSCLPYNCILGKILWMPPSPSRLPSTKPCSSKMKTIRLDEFQIVKA